MDIRMVLRAVFLPLLLLSCGQENLSAKVLKCPQVELLNIALEGMPYVLARLKLSSKGVIQVGNAIAEYELVNAVVKMDLSDNKKLGKAQLLSEQKAEKEFIRAQLKVVMEPIKEFFNEIRTHSSLVKPLFEESICSGAGVTKSSSYLMKFIESPLDLYSFFEKSTDTVEELKAVCNEFRTFLTDIDESLSVAVHHKYDQFIKNLKVKKIQAKSAAVKK